MLLFIIFLRMVCYRFGSFVVIPPVTTGIASTTFDFKQYQPIYDCESNMFVISIPSPESKLLLYTTGGVLLREIDAKEDKVALDASILPSIFVLCIKVDNQSYNFKLVKGK